MSFGFPFGFQLCHTFSTVGVEMTKASLQAELLEREGGLEFVGRSKFSLILGHHLPLGPEAAGLVVLFGGAALISTGNH